MPTSLKEKGCTRSTILAGAVGTVAMIEIGPQRTDRMSGDVPKKKIIVPVIKAIAMGMAYLDSDGYLLSQIGWLEVRIPDLNRIRSGRTLVISGSTADCRTIEKALRARQEELMK